MVISSPFFNLCMSPAYWREQSGFNNIRIALLTSRFSFSSEHLLICIFSRDKNEKIAFNHVFKFMQMTILVAIELKGVMHVCV